MTITANFQLIHLVAFQVSIGGTISGSLSQIIDPGSNCTAVKAVPNQSYRFLNWTGTGGFISTDNPLTVSNVTADMTITVNFQLVRSVAFQAGTGGTISGSLSQIIDQGSNCTEVKALPNPGYRFVNWTWTGTNGIFSTTSNPLTFSNVTSDMTITANFQLVHKVTFQASNGGSIIGSLSQTIEQDGNCTEVTAVTDFGYRFINWTGTNGVVSTTDLL